MEMKVIKLCGILIETRTKLIEMPSHEVHEDVRSYGVKLLTSYLEELDQMYKAGIETVDESDFFSKIMLAIGRGLK